jgi:(p)ppGpp synthase/HD superfamily hydrolase
MNRDLIIYATQFAHNAHYGVKRKYDDSPYILHPMRVAALVSRHNEATPQMVAAAWLHDVIEDTVYEYRDIRRFFGVEIASLVKGLTNPSQVVDEYKGLLRAERKRIDHVHMESQPFEVRLIKCCDRIDNCRDLPDSQKKYIEKRWLPETKTLRTLFNDLPDYYKSELDNEIERLEKLVNA